MSFVVKDDIDLCNGAWTPIGTGNHPFKGIFDGNNKTITNLNVYSTDASAPIGLFGYVTGTSADEQYVGTIKNVTIDGAKVISKVEAADAVGCGVAVGSTFAYSKIEGVTVKNAVVEGTHWVGGVCGNAYSTVKNCTVVNLTLTCNPVYWPGANDYNHENGDKAGGIIGYLGDAYEVSGCSVTNATISGYRDLGGICGYSHTGATFKSHSISDVRISGTATADQNYKKYTKKSEIRLSCFVSGPTPTDCTGTATITYPAYIVQD